MEASMTITIGHDLQAAAAKLLTALVGYTVTLTFVGDAGEQASGELEAMDDMGRFALLDEDGADVKVFDACFVKHAHVH